MRTMASWARRSLAALTIFMAAVICLVLLTETIRFPYLLQAAHSCVLISVVRVLLLRRVRRPRGSTLHVFHY
jgi:hypothetical protein